MSRLTTTTVAPGGVLSAANENAKFTEVATETARIDNENVRSEGVDMRTLGSMPAHTYVKFQDNASTTPTAYSDGYTLGGGAFGGDARQDLSHDSGTQIAFGSAGTTIPANGLMLIDWQVLQWDYTAIGAPGATASYCFVVQLYWDITDNTLSNFVPIESAPAFGDVFSPPGYSLDDTASISVIPVRHDTVYQAELYTSRGFYPFKPNASTTIYGLKLVLSGIYSIIHDPSGVTRAFDYFQPVLTTATIRVERATISAFVLRP